MTNEILHGDSFILTSNIPDGVIDFILTDPPYNITDFKWDKKKLQFDELWTEYKRILKPNGVIAIHSVQPFTTDLINSNREWFKYNYIWIKSQAANFQLAKKMPLKKHEDICIFYNKKPTYNPQMTKGALKPKRIGEKKYQDRKSEMYLSSRPANLEVVMSDMYYPTTILNYPGLARNKSEHPTQKPIELAEFLINTYTNEGEIVFDGFAGSGTTGVAAKNLNRQFILIEQEEKYFNTAKLRLT
jgi:site-specific DNA-methyltransferase (adenine-specific)